MHVVLVLVFSNVGGPGQSPVSQVSPLPLPCQRRLRTLKEEEDGGERRGEGDPGTDSFEEGLEAQEVWL